jgi:hypothetical protein
MQTAIVDTEYPLVVDLDGTLISTDLYARRVNATVEKKPAVSFFMCDLDIERKGIPEKQDIYSYSYTAQSYFHYNYGDT